MTTEDSSTTAPSPSLHSSSDSQFEVDFRAAASWTTRTYRKTTQSYFLENDATQSVRLNLQHHLVRQRFEGNNFRGIAQDLLDLGASVLDVGCGSGIWLAEMQRDFPEGEYVGMDIQSTEWINAFQQLSGEKIKFVQGDVLQTLPFDDETFDYIHQQNMFAAIPASQWPTVLAEFFRILKPGGYIDLVELEVPDFPNDTPSPRCAEFISGVLSIFSARGINGRIGRDLKSLVESGRLYENIEAVEMLGPLGWTIPGEPDEIGRLWAWDYRRMLESTEVFVSRAFGKTVEEWREDIEVLLPELASLRAGFPIHRVIAQRRM
ncbi:S-adenosyl-L-methionine-dependent methyltransferase [Cladochytrium replicatum]|nr:S-adenosyl-L-methionine-dependent methyltransferase [Cladochytrium replicatum]